MEYSWSNILQSSGMKLACCVDQNEWYFICRVAGLVFSSHVFSVTMIGGDNYDTPEFTDDLQDCFVGGFNGVDGRFEIASVAYHVSIGEINNKEVCILLVLE